MVSYGVSSLKSSCDQMFYGLVLPLLMLLLLSGQRVWSQTALQPPPPTGLMVESSSATSISLSWTAPVDDGNGAIEGYNIYRCDKSNSPDCSDFPYLAWVAAADGLGYKDTTVSSGKTYSYAVGAYRGTASDWSNEVTVTARINRPPEFPEDNYSFNLAENQGRGWQTPKGGLYANDPDGDNVALVYTLTAGNSPCRECGIKNDPYRHNLFRVVTTSTGDARITYQGKGEDYESFAANAAHYTLMLMAADADGANASVSVRINVTDVGEPEGNQPPRFRAESYSFNLAENQGRGWQTPKGGLYANDPDGDNVALVYTLTAGNSPCRECGIKNDPYRHNLFRVVTTSTGDARITYQGKGEDYESFAANAAHYTLMLMAADADGANASVSVRINVTDVGEPEGNQPPRFRAESYSFNLAENQGRGWQTPKGGLYANDPDGDNVALVYTLTAGNSPCRECGIKNDPYRHNLFRVVTTSTGDARITYQGKGEDYESFAANAAHYTLMLMAADADGANASVSVRINVTDVKEAPGVVTSLAVAIISPSSISLRWIAPSETGDNNLLGYNIYRCEEEDTPCEPVYYDWVPVADGSTYADTGVILDRTYRYAVNACNSNPAPSNCGDWSNQVVARQSAESIALTASFEGGFQWFKKNSFPELSGVTEWNSTAWRGERIHQHILIKSIPSYGQVSLSVGDFEINEQNPAAFSSIPASAVSFLHPQFVKGDVEVRTCEGYADRDTASYEASYLSDALFSKQQHSTSSVMSERHTVSIDGENVHALTQPPSWTVPVWMAIDIPSETRPGTYSGTITLSAKPKNPETPTVRETLRVSIHVSPWAMPGTAKRQFHLDLWQFPMAALHRHNDAYPEDSISLWSQDHYALLKPFYQYLAKLGQRTVSTHVQTMVRWTLTNNDEWEYDYSIFDAHVNQLAAWGIDHQISTFSIASWRDGNVDEIPYWDSVAQERKIFKADIGSPAWEERWGHFLTDFKSHLAAKGWFDKTVLYMDEVPESAMEEVIDLIRGNDANWKIGLAYGHNPGAHILGKLYDSSNTLLPAGASYADDGLTPGITYRYAVQACSGAGCGNWSEVATMVAQTPATPGVPKGLTAEAKNDGVTQLSWMSPSASGSSALTGYNIYRCVDGAASCSAPTWHAWAPVGTPTIYLDSGLITGTTYRYEVSACNESGCSSRTAPVSIVAQSLVMSGSVTQSSGSRSVLGDSSISVDKLPGAPTGLTAVAASATAVQLTWMAPATSGDSTLTGYNVYRCTGVGCTLTANDYLAWTNANARDGQTYADQVTTFYTSCFQKRPNSFVAADADPMDMMGLPWHALERRHDGYSRWAFDNWQSAVPLDLREDNHTAGDFSLVYRSSNDKKMTVVPSIRLEALREGMEDFEKVQVLRNGLSVCGENSLAGKWLGRLERTVASFSTGALMAGRAGDLVEQARAQLDQISQQLSPAMCQ